ncbi:ABC transporter substrate-binding protein [Rhodococcoides kyotonense]|uniref:Peptide/nickel transport system substrate-binding protein n=1 Tax=Rhodococcoides kyotonense TaxID=398843 RepID=A0A239N303_9NOCA|nr:ABC transporter substrate-binding protein [Rhodococcus kyotonensis]SNT48549.1 peptide/nickel transport system substrate-binding protein [Rhodococcus kyotonensis]
MKLAKLIGACAVASLALTACGTGGIDAAAFDWPEEGQPGGGGNVTIVSNTELSSLEPGEAGTAGQAFPVLKNVVQSLLTRNTETNEVEPLLATEWESVDPLHWTFTLRNDVTWHDGTPFDAENAARALTYVWDKSIPYAGNFVGDPVAFSAIDQYTLGIELTTPDPLVPAKMTMMPLASPTQIQNAPQTLSTTLIGTGPYKFVSYEPRAKLELELNPDYFDLHPGMFDTVSWIFRAENQVRAQLVQAGEADIAMDVTGEQCQASVSATARCIENTRNGFRFLRPDFYNQTVLSDPRIRQAVAHAVDRSGITSAFIASSGVPVDNPGPEGMVGYSEDVATYEYDVDKAKQLVADAKADGINTDLPLTIKYRTGFFPNIDDIAQSVATNLNAAGLNAKVEALPDAEGLAQYRQNFEANSIENIAPDRGWIFLATTSNDLYDFSQLGDTLLSCDGKFSVYCNPDFQAKYDAASAQQGEARQDEFASLWDAQYAADAPIVPIAAPTDSWVVSNRVSVEFRSDLFIPLTEARGAQAGPS